MGEKVTVVKNTCILVNQTKDMDMVLAKDTIMDQVENTLESQVKEKVTVVKSTCILVNQTKDMDTVLAKDTVDVLTKVEKDILPLVVHMDQVKDTVDVLTKVKEDILPIVENTVMERASRRCNMIFF